MHVLSLFDGAAMTIAGTHYPPPNLLSAGVDVAATVWERDRQFNADSQEAS
ncbi:MAG: hypothetical protein ACR2KU_00655 [Gammaproteobacteria bacterium]